MIPAYSPQARGRSERSFGTWQGRLPQELRLRGIRTMEQANDFLEKEYVAEFNQQFQVPALQEGSAFLRCQRKDLNVLFPVQQERVVSRDNTGWSEEGRRFTQASVQKYLLICSANCLLKNSASCSRF
jgi:hypothetical protein